MIDLLMMTMTTTTTKTTTMMVMMMMMVVVELYIYICDRLRQKQAFGKKISFADFSLELINNNF